MLPYLKPHSPCSTMLCPCWPFQNVWRTHPPPHRAWACPVPLPGKLFSPALPVGRLLCIFTSWLDVPSSGPCSRPSMYLRSLWAENPVLFLFNSYLYGYLCNILVLCRAVASWAQGPFCSQCLILASETGILYFIKSLALRLLCSTHSGTVLSQYHASPLLTFSGLQVPAGQSPLFRLSFKALCNGDPSLLSVLFLRTPFNKVQNSKHSELLAIPKTHFMLYSLHLCSYCSLYTGMYSLCCDRIAVS